MKSRSVQRQQSKEWQVYVTLSLRTWLVRAVDPAPLRRRFAHSDASSARAASADRSHASRQSSVNTASNESVRSIRSATIRAVPGSPDARKTAADATCAGGNAGASVSIACTYEVGAL